MNREIKFKVYWKDENTGSISADIAQIRIGQRSYSGGSQQSNFRDLIGFCQYTGLHDKSGLEVYEGDILQFTRRHQSGFNCAGGCYENETKEDFRAVVVFDEGGYELKDSNCYPFEPLLSMWSKSFDKDKGCRLLWELHVHENRIGGHNDAVYCNPIIIGNIYENPDLLK